MVGSVVGASSVFAGLERTAVRQRQQFCFLLLLLLRRRRPSYSIASVGAGKPAPTGRLERSVKPTFHVGLPRFNPFRIAGQTNRRVSILPACLQRQVAQRRHYL
jgi:hypothetical protein